MARPTSGTARIDGVDVVADPVLARQQLAVVPQRSNLDRAISIRDNLIFHAAYHGVPAREREARADEILEQFGLLDRARIKPDFFSGGQSQRVMIARALMHAPKVLFLDEPTTGLDPAARLFVWDRLKELKASGVTMLLTTHDMDEAAELSDRVGIMDHGKLLALDTPEALMRSLRDETTLELSADGQADGAAIEALSALPGVARIERVQAAQNGGGPPGTALRPQHAGRPRAARAPLPLGRRAAARRACRRRARRARTRARRRQVRVADPGGRLHPPHRKDAARMSAIAADAWPRHSEPRLLRGPLPRPVRHRPRAARVPGAGDPAAALHAVRVREGAEQPRLHPARLQRPALPGPRGADVGADRDADARVPARRRVRLDARDRGPAAGADADELRGAREGGVRDAALVRRGAGDDPDRDPDPGLDPVALVGGAAVPRRRSSSAPSSARASGC